MSYPEEVKCLKCNQDFCRGDIVILEIWQFFCKKCIDENEKEEINDIFDEYKNDWEKKNGRKWR